MTDDCSSRAERPRRQPRRSKPDNDNRSASGGPAPSRQHDARIPSTLSISAPLKTHHHLRTLISPKAQLRAFPLTTDAVPTSHPHPAAAASTACGYSDRAGEPRECACAARGLGLSRRALTPRPPRSKSTARGTARGPHKPRHARHAPRRARRLRCAAATRTNSDPHATREGGSAREREERGASVSNGSSLARAHAATPRRRPSGSYHPPRRRLE